MKKKLILVGCIVLSIIACSKKSENNLPQLQNAKTVHPVQLNENNSFYKIDTPYIVIDTPYMYQPKIDTPYLGNLKIDTPYTP